MEELELARFGYKVYPQHPYFAPRADGRYLIKDILALGMSKEGKGWVDYKWPNPSTGTIDSKRTYVERVEDVIIGCGIYK